MHMYLYVLSHSLTLSTAPAAYVYLQQELPLNRYLNIVIISPSINLPLIHHNLWITFTFLHIFFVYFFIHLQPVFVFLYLMKRLQNAVLLLFIITDYVVPLNHNRPITQR